MSEEQHNHDDGSVHGWRGAARFLLLAYVVCLVGLAYWSASNPGWWETIAWQPDGKNWIMQTGGQVGSSVLKDLVLCLVLGFLTGAACAPGYRDASFFGTLFAVVLGFVFSSSIALGFRTYLNGTPLIAPSFIVVIYTLLTCLWGSWLGATWLRSEGVLGWMINQVLLTVLFIVSGAAALAWFAMSAEPLSITSLPVTTEDRRRLVDLFQEHDPRDLEPNQTTEITLSEQDLNQLASWGLSLAPGEHHAQLGLTDNRVDLQMTLHLPSVPVFHRNLNVVAAGRIQTRKGELGFLPIALQVGRITVPATLLEFCGPIVIGDAWQNETTKPFFSSLETIEIKPNAAKIAYGHLDIKKGFVHDTLVGLGMLEDLEPATSAQVSRLIVLAEANPDLTFRQCFETAFAEARTRSENGGAARENKAAILALGYLLGHSKVRSFVGADVPKPTPEIQRRFRQATLRNRHDWARHYTLSAALQVLSNALASMDVGLLKEELDADGGSGFSFGDLLADRSGTMLAVRATESDAAAEAIQQRVARGFVEAEFMPPGSDLPEGLTDQQFNREYGGVGGKAYQRTLADIDRRIANCAAYQQNN